MGDLFTVIPPELREEYRDEKLEENYKILKILPLVVMLSSALYLLQYRFFPGVESLSEYKINYIFLFLFAFSVSLIYKLSLPLLLKIKSIGLKEHINRFYFISMFIFCITLSVFDLQLSTDFSAYAVGLLSLAFLIREKLRNFILLSFGGFVIFNISFYLVGNNILPINESLPVFVFTILAIYIVYSKGQTKIQLFILKHELRESSIKDPLTNLYNRRYMVEFLHKQIAFFKRYETKTSVLILDIDYFKSVNDKLGHGVGDSVLKEISNLIENEIRETDLACRYGGEEFVIILSDSNLKKSRIIAERIRTIIEKYNFESVSWTITVSIGVSESMIGDNEPSILERADKNLYKAKESGRNRTVSS